MNRKSMRNQKGVSLIEALIALAILGVIAIAFLGGLMTSLKAVSIADERSTAQSLAQSQMEYVKSLNYTDADPGSEVTYNKTAGIPQGYYVRGLHREGYTSTGINFTHTSEDIIGVPWDPDNGTASYNDTGIQKITVIIYHPYDAAHPDVRVLTLADYKVRR